MKGNVPGRNGGLQNNIIEFDPFDVLGRNSGGNKADNGPSPVPDELFDASSRPRFCKYCGNRLMSDDMCFCDKCGKRLVSPEIAKQKLENIKKSVNPETPVRPDPPKPEEPVYHPIKSDEPVYSPPEPDEPVYAPLKPFHSVAEEPEPVYPGSSRIPSNAPGAYNNNDDRTVGVDPDDDDEIEAPAAPKQRKLIPYLHCVSTNSGTYIRQPVFKIGSKQGVNDLAITGNRYLSREHARLVLRAGDCFLIDNGSTNKTFINGAQIESGIECKLNDGDEIRMANELFYFFIKEADGIDNTSI